METITEILWTDRKPESKGIYILSDEISGNIALMLITKIHGELMIAGHPSSKVHELVFPVEKAHALDGMLWYGPIPKPEIKRED